MPKTKLQVYFISHLRAILASLGKTIKTPISSFLTILVISITLTFPASLYILLQNLEKLVKQWDLDSTQITLYLKPGLAEQKTQALLKSLQADQDIAKTSYISPAQGLQDFASTIKAEKVVSMLSSNPLPGVFLIQPSTKFRDPNTITSLLNKFAKIPEVDSAQLDMQWLQRIHNIILLTERIVIALSLLLGIGILLIIGNTILLTTQNERHEIAVLQQVGATNAFIRRPFIYIGIWYGLCGGVIAWILIQLLLFWLYNPITNLIHTYNSDFKLVNFSLKNGINLIGFSIGLGILGAWSAVSSHLHALNSARKK